jgi:hypothetical protein
MLISPSSTKTPLRSTRLIDSFPSQAIPLDNRETKIGVASRSRLKVLSLMMSSLRIKGLFKSSLAGNLSAAEPRQLSMKLLTSSSLILERAIGFIPYNCTIIAPFI